jgi:hypothetical protein
LAVVALAPALALFLLFWFYALSPPLRYVLFQARRQPVPTHSPGLD